MSSIFLKEKDVRNQKLHSPAVDQGTSYEVFRNNSTAVEVVVKDVLRGKKKPLDFDYLNLNRVQADVNKLNVELDNTHKLLAKTKKCFYSILREMKTLIDASNARESETQAAYLALKLENEKLRILLESKTKLVSRSKKELSLLKRILKSSVKSISNTPEIPGVFENCSDTDYEDFESELRSNSQTPMRTKTPNKTDTFDTTFSVKDHCFDKK